MTARGRKESAANVAESPGSSMKIDEFDDGPLEFYEKVREFREIAYI